MCKKCHRLKRKFQTGLRSERPAERLCVKCQEWKSPKQMRYNSQYIDALDNICVSCWNNDYRDTFKKKKKGIKQPSARTVRFGLQGEERRCAYSKHWVIASDMEKDASFSGGLGLYCLKCRVLPPRKLRKSKRKHLFGGRKITQQEYDHARINQ